MESPRTVDERRVIPVDLGDGSIESPQPGTSEEETSFSSRGRRKPVMPEDLDAIEPLEDIESQPIVIIPDRREAFAGFSVAAGLRGVIILQVVFAVVALVIQVASLALPMWVCNTTNGTGNACCGPWKICSSLLTFDNERAFDSFEEIGSFGVANVSLISLLTVITLVEAILTPLSAKVPWICLLKIKMINCCCVCIIYVAITALFHNMMPDLRRFGFRAGTSIHINYVGFVTAILLFVLIIVEYCAHTFRRDARSIF